MLKRSVPDKEWRFRGSRCNESVKKIYTVIVIIQAAAQLLCPGPAVSLINGSWIDDWRQKTRLGETRVGPVLCSCILPRTQLLSNELDSVQGIDQGGREGFVVR